jgi:hypothetical protein
MARGPMSSVLRRIRRLAGTSAPAAPGDAEVLARFTAVQDEAAFTALVERHGPMVLAVCRRILRNGHDAEDAFQATFLILVRRAGSITRPGALGCWLATSSYLMGVIEARAGAVHPGGGEGLSRPLHRYPRLLTATTPQAIAPCRLAPFVDGPPAGEGPPDAISRVC